jgi:uncharacterized protein (DUF427 family)
VSLTAGRGPLSGKPAGRFTAPIPDGVAYLEPHPRRVRGFDAHGRAVVDSERALLVHRSGHPPTYAFPAEDVHGVPTSPEPDAPGYVHVPWDSVDAWYEEEERLLGHPRNPYHRIDILRASRHVRAAVSDEVLVDTTDTTVLCETGLPPRLYVRPELVRTELLVRSPTTTFCPYKGTATYWTARLRNVEVPDVAWSYEEPLPESLPIAGLLSFDETRVTLDHDLPAGG